ncbi:hypothetical protein ACFE04_027796 [Oxalis oulophora]
MIIEDGKIVVILKTVNDDIRVYDLPVIKVTPLRFTETARARIEESSGESLTFDKLALRAFLNQNKADKADRLIGKGGSIVRALQNENGASIQITDFVLHVEVIQLHSI